jgi:hypothetical protein
MIKQYIDRENTPLNFHNVFKILVIFNIIYSLIVTGGALFDLFQEYSLPYIIYFLSNFFFTTLLSVILILLYIGLRKFNMIIIYLIAALLGTSIIFTVITLGLLSLYNVLRIELIIEQIFYLVRNILVQSLIFLYYYKRIPLLDHDMRNTFRKKEKVFE